MSLLPLALFELVELINIKNFDDVFTGAISPNCESKNWFHSVGEHRDIHVDGQEALHQSLQDVWVRRRLGDCSHDPRENSKMIDITTPSDGSHKVSREINE